MPMLTSSAMAEGRVLMETSGVGAWAGRESYGEWSRCRRDRPPLRVSDVSARSDDASAVPGVGLRTSRTHLLKPRLRCRVSEPHAPGFPNPCRRSSTRDDRFSNASPQGRQHGRVRRSARRSGRSVRRHELSRRRMIHPSASQSPCSSRCRVELPTEQETERRAWSPSCAPLNSFARCNDSASP